jgi:hypothetical protein
MIPAGTRDIRPSAFELKFVVDCDLGARIREAARALLSPDPHASGPAADEYLTNTIYLDTEEFAVYRRRGSFRRAKYRIRRYGQGNAVFLERKLRTADVLSKRRSVVLADELHRLSGDLNGEAWAGRWFHERMLMRRLMPVCQVSYARTARVGVTDYGPVRLTLDEALAGAPVNEPVFQDATPLKLFPGKTIVEMKFTAVMPAPFKKIVEDFAIAPQRVSKYRLGVEGARSLSPLTHPPSEDTSAYA